MCNPLCVQTSLCTNPKRRETHSHHFFAVWGLLGADTLPYSPSNYTKFTYHNSPLRKLWETSASKESELGMTEELHIINYLEEFQYSVPKTTLVFAFRLISRAIRSCWITLKLLIFEHIPVFHFPSSIKYFGAFFSLSLKVIIFQSVELTFTSLSHQLALACHKLPYQPPWLINGKEQMSKSVSIMEDSSLLFIYVISMTLPPAGEPSAGRESLVLTEPSPYICMQKLHIHPLLQLRGSN